MAKCIISFQLPSLPCCQQVTRRWEWRVWCDVARELLLGMPLRKLVAAREIFLHQLALVRAVMLWWKEWPGQDETNKQHYLKKSGAVDIITIIVITLCFVFATYSTIFLFCHKTSLWWGQTLHLTICATLALYFFFLLQLSKIRAAALGLQLLLL